MSNKAQQIAEMIDMLPEQEQEFAYEVLKRIVLAWDSDYTKVTPEERKQIEEAENSGYISESEIDWDNLDKLDLA